MPSTHLSLHYHLVFGTKHHEPVIAAAWRPRLHAFLGGILQTIDGGPGSNRGRGGSCAPARRLARHALPRGCDAGIESGFIPLGARGDAAADVCVAGRRWRVHGQCFAGACGSRVCRRAGAAPSLTDFSRGIPDAAATDRGRIRRPVCLLKCAAPAGAGFMLDGLRWLAPPATLRSSLRDSCHLSGLSRLKAMSSSIRFAVAAPPFMRRRS